MVSEIENVQTGLATEDYKYGFSMPENYFFKSRKGLDETVVREISAMKSEPDWMTRFRLRALKLFQDKPMPQWGGQLNNIDFNDIFYYVKASDRNHYAAEVERERQEMQDLPDMERNEVREIFERWDFQGEDLEEMVDKITSKPKAWLELMMAHELNLAPVEKTQARRSAILVGLAAILGSLVPLIPFIVIGRDILLGIAVSLVVSAITLFLIGWWKARTTVGRPTRSGVQMAIIGLASAIAGFGIAFLVSGGVGA